MKSVENLLLSYCVVGVGILQIASDTTYKIGLLFL